MACTAEARLAELQQRILVVEAVVVPRMQVVLAIPVRLDKAVMVLQETLGMQELVAAAGTAAAAPLPTAVLMMIAVAAAVQAM